MKLETLYFSIFFILLSSRLSGQNISDYKILIKVNLSDLVFMGRFTLESEVPIFKNTSLLMNLGVHHKDYFYDNLEKTHSNFGMFRSTPAIFPTKNILGWNTGIGLRQYFHIQPKALSTSFIEIKGFYRKSNFSDDFQVFYDFGSGNGGSQEHRVSGNQQLYSLYFALGRMNVFKNKKISLECSFGFTKNFVNLNTCLDGCSIPSWALPPFFNPDGSYPPSWIVLREGYYQSKDPFKYLTSINSVFYECLFPLYSL